MTARFFKKWQRGGPLDASRLNDQHDARNFGIVGGRGINVVHGRDGIVIQLQEDRIIPAPGKRTTVAGGASHFEVVINGVFQLWTECANDPDCSDFFANDEALFFPHIGCNPVLSDGTIDQATYIPVHPNWGHSLAEFSAVAWDVTNPNQPTFSVFPGARGLTMSFGQGEAWVAPPTNLCGGIPMGACCILGVCSILDQETCGLDGTYQGDGTTCSPDPCVPQVGACCFFDGSCDEILEAQCEISIGATYQGDGTTCIPDPCAPPPITGVCCLANGKCRAGVQQNDCLGFEDGFYPGDTTCGGQPGACCLAGAICIKVSPFCCTKAGGVFFGGPCNQANCL